MKKLATTFAIIFIGLFSYAQVGSIENVIVEQRTDGTGMVDIFFDLTGPESGVYNISFEASFDGGETYSVLSGEYLVGDLVEVSPAVDIHIEWDGFASHPDVYTEEAMLKIMAVQIGGDDEFTVTDIDGNVYPTVIVGGREWMAKNLRVSKYANGDPIPHVQENSEWPGLENGAYCIYPHDGVLGIDSDEEMADAYGYLYNFHVIDDPRDLCPEGWHVPTDAEWTQLIDYKIGNYEEITNNNIAQFLKSCRQVGAPQGGDCDVNEHPRWNPHSAWYATDDFGFSALPSGARLHTNGSFIVIGANSYVYSSTRSSAEKAWIRNIMAGNNGISRSELFTEVGAAIRCIKSEE